MSQRNNIFDMMKGVGILLVVYYHLSSDLGPVIHSFTLPLFYILSGYFAKDVSNGSDLLTVTKKSARRLLLPYLVTMGILLFLGSIKWMVTGSSDVFIGHVLRLLWSGADLKSTEYGVITNAPLWFLVSLCWTREIFSVLRIGIVRVCRSELFSLWLLLSVCVVISVVAVAIFPYVNPAPLCIIQGCQALVFYAVGYCVKKKLFPKWSYYVAIVCWPAAIVWGGVNLMFCYIKIYPLSVIGACGGTYVVYLICKWADSFFSSHFKSLSFAPQSIVWCGRASLTILCMNSIDMLSDTIIKLMNLLPFNYGEWGVIGFRFAMAILLAVVVTHLPVLKKVYA